MKFSKKNLALKINAHRNVIMSFSKSTRQQTACSQITQGNVPHPELLKYTAVNRLTISVFIERLAAIQLSSFIS